MLLWLSSHNNYFIFQRFKFKVVYLFIDFNLYSFIFVIFYQTQIQYCGLHFSKYLIIIYFLNNSLACVCKALSIFIHSNAIINGIKHILDNNIKFSHLWNKEIHIKKLKRQNKKMQMWASYMTMTKCLQHRQQDWHKYIYKNSTRKKQLNKL